MKIDKSQGIIDVRITMSLTRELSLSFKMSPQYPSENAKCEIGFMFLTHQPTYDNVKRRFLCLEKAYMMSKGSFSKITSI